MIKYVEHVSISSHKRANLQNLVKVVSVASDPDRKARPKSGGSGTGCQTITS